MLNTKNDERIEEIANEFTKWHSAETTFAYGVPNDKTIADWWIEKLHQELQKARHDCLLEAIEKIEIARQEHNDARHGDSTDDAYDRACDAINPDLHQSELDQPK